MKCRLAVLLACISILSSCEKTVTFNLDTTTPKLVVDGNIENGQAPVIVLSKSLDYFSEITPEILQNSFVHNAIVKVSNGTKTHQLKEYTFTQNSVNLYYYSIDPASPSTAFLGELNKNYNLEILVDGKTYTASTTIPGINKTIDSIWWKPAPNNPDTTLVVVMGKFTDPKGYGNYIRYFTKVNREAFYPGQNSVFDDQIVDGTTYSVQIEKGVNRNEKIDQETYAFFHRGDTATIKFTNIDKGTFDFWRTMEYSYSSVGNPFSTPTKVQSNITNGLGYFGGYAAQFKTIIIPK